MKNWVLKIDSYPLSNQKNLIITFFGEAAARPAGDIPARGEAILALFCNVDALIGDS